MAVVTLERKTEPLMRAVHGLTRANDEYDALLDMIDNARLVLIGEASHGTHEFYRERAQITNRLKQTGPMRIA